MARGEIGRIRRDPGARLRVAGWAIVAAAAIVVYVNTLPYAYVYDDINEIRGNSRVHRLGSIPSLLTTEFLLAKRGEGFLYRPVTAATIPPLFVAGGGSPAIFHAANILLHAFVSAMLAVILAALTGRRRLGLAAGLLFAVLPIHTEAVAWISGRSELLAAAAGMAAWWFHLRARPGGRPWAAAGAMIFLALALGSKESAVAWPFLFAAADRLDRGPEGRRPRPPVRLYAGYAGLLAAWVLARLAVLGQLGRQPGQGAALLNPLEGLSWWPAYPFTALRLAFFSVFETLVPSGACIDYGFDQIRVASSLLHLDVAAGAALLAALGLLVWRGIVRSGTGETAGLLGLSAAAFVLFWFPVSSLLLASVSIFAERNMYMPSAGICVAAAAGAAACGDRLGRPRLATALGLAAVVALGSATIARNRAYEDGLSLYASSSRSCPRSARARFLHGTALQELGRLDEAADAYRGALSISPGYVEARAALAEALGRRGRIEEGAREAAMAARDAAAGDAGTRLGAAWALASTGSPAAADDELRALEKEFPGDARVLFMRGQLLAATGRLEQALAIYSALDDRFPDSPAGMNGVASVRMMRGDDRGAREALDRALEIDPYDSSALFNKGLLVLRDPSGGITAAREARDLLDRFLRIRPRDALGWIHLGEARARLGELDRAEAALRRAVSLAPGHPRPRRALEEFLENGSVGDAVVESPAIRRPPS